MDIVEKKGINAVIASMGDYENGLQRIKKNNRKGTEEDQENIDSLGSYSTDLKWRLTYGYTVKDFLMVIKVK